MKVFIQLIYKIFILFIISIIFFYSCGLSRKHQRKPNTIGEFKITINEEHYTKNDLIAVMILDTAKNVCSFGLSTKFVHENDTHEIVSFVLLFDSIMNIPPLKKYELPSKQPIYYKQFGDHRINYLPIKGDFTINSIDTKNYMSYDYFISGSFNAAAVNDDLKDTIVIKGIYNTIPCWYYYEELKIKRVTTGQ